MNAKIEAADGVVEEKLEFQMGHGGQPFLEGFLFAVAEQVRPIVEDQDGFIGQTVR